MRTFLILTCLANIVFAFCILPWMPEKAAYSFASDGMPNSSMPAIAVAFQTSSQVVVTAIGFFCISFVVFPIIVTHLANLFFIPNHNYWLNESKRPQTVRHFQTFIETIGVGMMFFILIVQWLIFQANLLDPPKMPIVSFVAASSLITIAIIVAIVRLYRSFRLPKEVSETESPTQE